MPRKKDKPAIKISIIDLQQDFLTALQNNDTEALVELILQNNKFLHFKDVQGDTLVHHAITWGNHTFLEFLLNQGAEPCLPNKLGEEPLHVAIQQPKSQEVLALLREALQRKLYKIPLNDRLEDSDLIITDQQDLEASGPNATQTWQVAGLHPLRLHELVLRGDLKEAIRKLWQGVQTLSYWLDKAHYTPLHLAAALGNQTIVEKLVNTIPFEWLYIKNIRGQTPLLLATKHGHVAIIKCLLKTNYRYCLELANLPNHSAVPSLQMALRMGKLEVFSSIFTAACEQRYSQILKKIDEIRNTSKDREAFEMHVDSFLKDHLTRYHPAALIKLIKKSSTNQRNENVQTILDVTIEDFEDIYENELYLSYLKWLVVDRNIWQELSKFNATDELAMVLLNLDCQLIIDSFDSHTVFYWSGFYRQFAIFNWLMRRWNNFCSLRATHFEQYIKQALEEKSGLNILKEAKVINKMQIMDYCNSLSPILKDDYLTGIIHESKFPNRTYWDFSYGNYTQNELLYIFRKIKPVADSIEAINFAHNNFNIKSFSYILRFLRKYTSNLMSLDFSYNVIGNTSSILSDDGIKLAKLIETCQKLKKLKKITLLNTQLNSDEIKQLHEALPKIELQFTLSTAPSARKSSVSIAARAGNADNTESSLPDTPLKWTRKRSIKLATKADSQLPMSFSSASSSSLIDAYPQPRVLVTHGLLIEEEIHEIPESIPENHGRKVATNKPKRAIVKRDYKRNIFNHYGSIASGVLLHDKGQESDSELNEQAGLLTYRSSKGEIGVDILDQYRHPSILSRIVRSWMYSITLQNLIIHVSSINCACGCCSRCQSKSSNRPTRESAYDRKGIQGDEAKRSSRDLIEILAGTNSPSVLQSSFAPFAYFAKPHTRKIAKFIGAFTDYFNWALEKGWLIILSFFIYKGLHDYIAMPNWQRKRINLLELLIAKTVEERLASYADNVILFGSLGCAASLIGFIVGSVQAYRQHRHYQPYELELLKQQVLYYSPNPFIVGFHELLEILEIPAVISFLILAPPIVFFLTLFKIKHLVKPGPLHDLKYAILWDTRLEIKQRAELFDVLLRVCRTHQGFGQMEAVAVLADIVYHLNLEQLDTLRQQLNDSRLQAEYPENDDFVRAQQIKILNTLYSMKRQGLQLLAELGEAPLHGYGLALERYHPRALNARFHNWRLGMERSIRTNISMLPLYLYTRIPRQVSFALFVHTLIDGIKERAAREHERRECLWNGITWSYVPSLGEYGCSYCPDFQIPYRYMHSTESCAQGFLNASRTLEQWQNAFNYNVFYKTNKLDLSGQSQIIQQGQLPTLLSLIIAHFPKNKVFVPTLVINNKQDVPYALSFEDLLAIGNFTRSYTEFDSLQLEHQNIGLALTAKQLGQFAASLNPHLQELILSYNQLGPKNTSLFFANLPRNLEFLKLNYNDLDDADGQALAHVLLELSELKGLDLSNNLQITDQSGIALVSTLTEHNNLIDWDLSATNVGDGTVIQYNKASRNFTEDTPLILNMRQCPQLSDASGLTFAESLKNNVSFSVLFITSNPQMTPITLQAVTDALPYAQSLLAFGVGSPRFTNVDEVIDFLNTLSKQTDLILLDLSSTPLASSESVRALASTLFKLPNLISLALTNTQLTDASFKHLLPALKQSKLEVLLLDNNPGLTDISIQALIANPPTNLREFDLSNNNFTRTSAASLGQLLHKVPLQILNLAHNLLGPESMSEFAPYLPESPLQELGLSHCGLTDKDALKLAEMLTEDQIPDDWLGSFDRDTRRALALGNPGTNLSLINLSFNAIGEVGIIRLCEVLPGSDVSVNRLILVGNPVNTSLLSNCDDIGLKPSSAGNRLMPSGPYAWPWQLWRFIQAQYWHADQSKAQTTALPQDFTSTQTLGSKVKIVLPNQLSELNISREELQNCRNVKVGQINLSVAVIPNRDRELHVLNTRCEIAQVILNQQQSAEDNLYSTINSSIYNTASSFLNGAGYAIGLTGIPPLGAAVLQKVGMAKERASVWAEGLRQLFSLAFLLWSSPSQAIITFMLGAVLYRICPDRETGRFVQMMATIFMLAAAGLWQGNNNLETAALQMTVSGLGSISGQLIAQAAVRKSKSIWQSSASWWSKAPTPQPMLAENQVQNSNQNQPLGFSHG